MSDEILYLSEMPIGSESRILRFDVKDSGFINTLEKKGFLPNTLIKRSEVSLNDPMVYFIRGSRVCLRKIDASKILVKGIK